MQINKELG